MRFSRLLFALLLAPAALGAQFFPTGRQADTTAPASDTVPAPVVDSASPRASVAGFLKAARAGDFERAAHWLDQSTPESAARATDLARRLKSVLDSRLWIDVETISPRATGDLDDELPRDREQLGVITTEDEREVAIRLARVQADGATRWVFSAATVAQIDSLYETLPDNWIREHLPAPLLAAGPFDVLYWQWIALAVLLPLSFFIGLTVGSPTRAILRKLVSKTPTDFDDQLIAAARGPITLFWAVVASRVLLRWIALSTPAQAFVVELQKALLTVAAFWVILRAIGVLQDDLPKSKLTESNPALRSLIPLGGRIARVIVFAIAVLTVISQFGYPIATILAGLGIGGIAVALGAQKSLEHFFGSVSIGIDQPFNIGDWVNVGGTEGEVESIGLRSTRIRTIQRTVVTIPNGQLAESRAENFGKRDRFVFRSVIGVEYGTRVATMRRIRDEIEQLLRAHPKMFQERLLVWFTNFGAYSLDIELLCWLEAADIWEFRVLRQDLMFQIMEIVERNGASFAFPTQTVHVVRGDGA